MLNKDAVITNDAEDMFSDLNDLEEMTFDDAELEESDKEQKEFDLAAFMINIEQLLPEFDDYFQKNRHQILETLLDSAAIDDISQELQYALANESKNIKFNNDDEVITAIFHYLSIDLLEKRMKTMKEFYREHLIKIHKETSDSKTLSLPIVDIQESFSSAKPNLTVKPNEFVEYLDKTKNKDKFFSSLTELKWENVTKASYTKFFELMKVSKSDDVKDFYKFLEQEGIVAQSGGGSSYKILPKLDI